jgi:hypothetical protein
MASLISTLREQNVVVSRLLEDATARHAVYGGDLGTHLLEIEAIDEWTLLSAAATTMGLDAAPVGALPTPAPAIARLVPSELAVRRRVVPIARSGHVLTVAVSEAIAPESAHDLSLELALRIKVVATLSVRLEQALAKLYGVPLSERTARVIAGLDERAVRRRDLGGVDERPSSLVTPLPHSTSRPVTHVRSDAPVARFSTPGALPNVQAARPLPSFDVGETTLDDLDDVMLRAAQAASPTAPVMVDPPRETMRGLGRAPSGFQLAAQLDAWSWELTPEPSGPNDRRRDSTPPLSSSGRGSGAPPPPPSQPSQLERSSSDRPSTAPGARKLGKPVPREEADRAASPTAALPPVAPLPPAVPRLAVPPLPPVPQRPQFGLLSPQPPVAAKPQGLPPRLPTRTPSGFLMAASDVDPELAEALAKVLDRSDVMSDAFKALVGRIDQVMPLLASRFPGPLDVSSASAPETLPEPAACGPLLALLVAAPRQALPLVTVQSASPRVEHRFWATHVLGAVGSSSASNAVLPRLFDEDLAVRRIARRAAASLLNVEVAAAPLVQGLAHVARNVEAAITRRMVAIDTLGELRSARVVPTLLALLADRSSVLVDAARRSLFLLTAEDAGRSPTEWNAWWAANSSRDRVEWLVDALASASSTSRKVAVDELARVTEQRHVSGDEGPEALARAQSLYRAWLTTSRAK